LGGAFRLAYVVHREPFFETQRLRGHGGWRGLVVRSGFAMVMDRRGLRGYWQNSNWKWIPWLDSSSAWT
jgi:hypothetical protein